MPGGSRVLFMDTNERVHKMKAETLSMVHVEQLAEGANPKYIEGLREWDYEEVITELARDNLAAERAMKQANQAVLAASETIQKLVAENAALKARTVTVPKKAYLRDMRCNVVRWSQVIDALSDAGIAFVRDDGELIAGTRETPVTDAAIAEIGAKAIEQAAESAPWLYGSQLGVQVEAVPREELVNFAANLRAGRKG